jgi:hypothetical protein
MWYGFEKDVKGIARLFTNNFAGGFNQIVETYSDSVDLIADFDPQNLTGSYDFMY